MVVLEDDAELLVSRRALAELLGRLLRTGFDGVASLGYHARGRPDAATEWDLAASEDYHHDFGDARFSVGFSGRGGGRGGGEEGREGGTEVAVAPLLPKRRFLGGTFGYVISAAQAGRFLAAAAGRVGTGGFDQSRGTFAVDHFMRETAAEEHWMAASPRVVHAAFAYVPSTAVGHRDSDVIGVTLTSDVE